MSHEPLIDAAARIADGQVVDWASITSTPMSDGDRALADELAVVARIAQGHRQLHELLPAAPDTPAALAPDRARWGHLDLLDVVGRGSYGTVYRAWDTRLERLVALKLFHGAPDPEAVMREGRMLARVRHEHVVTVYGADVIDGTAGLWMEMVHGRTLDRLIKDQGPMDAREAAAIGVDVSRALAAVHEASVLHCDVKAQNVVREAAGRVVLMDLGAGCVAPEARDSDQLSDVAGTPRYMAPELFHAGASPTRASDIYSVGVLLYYLVTGKFPVDGHSLGDLKRAHAMGRITPLASRRADLPSAYLDVVTSALDPVVERRPASVAAVCAALLPVAAPPEPVPAPRPMGRWAVAAVGVLVLGLAVLRPLVTPSAPTAPAVQSIAVLPIRNLTGDESKAYVADGLTEVLISNLARVRSLRVPSFAAVAGLRSSDEPPADLARKLGVQLLLAGSVTQADSQLRMSVQLIDAATGAAIWGEELRREAAGMISAQADIARMVASRLALTLSAEEVRGLTQAAVDPRAQDAYLRGLTLDAAGPARAADAGRAYREAVELAPGFAPAWAELALTELRLVDQSMGVDRKQRADIARSFAERAIQLDDTLAVGYVALGSVQFYEDWNLELAEQTLRRAIDVDPSDAFAHQRLSMLLAARGRLEEAAAAGRAATALEPLVARRATTLGGVYYYARQFDQAIAEARRALDLAPGNAVALHLLGRVASAQGRHDEAIAQLHASYTASPITGYLAELARAYAAAGRPADKDAALRELDARERQGQASSPDAAAYIAAAEGRLDAAFAILEQAVDQRVQGVLWLAVDPRVDPLRGDPRFDRLLARAGLTP